MRLRSLRTSALCILVIGVRGLSAAAQAPAAGSGAAKPPWTALANAKETKSIDAAYGEFLEARESLLRVDRSAFEAMARLLSAMGSDADRGSVEADCSRIATLARSTCDGSYSWNGLSRKTACAAYADAALKLAGRLSPALARAKESGFREILEFLCSPRNDCAYAGDAYRELAVKTPPANRSRVLGLFLTRYSAWASLARPEDGNGKLPAKDDALAASLADLDEYLALRDAAALASWVLFDPFTENPKPWGRFRAALAAFAAKAGREHGVPDLDLAMPPGASARFLFFAHELDAAGRESFETVSGWRPEDLERLSRMLPAAAADTVFEPPAASRGERRSIAVSAVASWRSAFLRGDMAEPALLSRAAPLAGKDFPWDLFPAEAREAFYSRIAAIRKELCAYATERLSAGAGAYLKAVSGLAAVPAFALEAEYPTDDPAGFAVVSWTAYSGRKEGKPLGLAIPAALAREALDLEAKARYGAASASDFGILCASASSGGIPAVFYGDAADALSSGRILAAFAEGRDAMDGGFSLSRFPLNYVLAPEMSSGDASKAAETAGRIALAARAAHAASRVFGSPGKDAQ